MENPVDIIGIVFTGTAISYFMSQAAATMISSASIPASAINAGELLHFQSPSLTERTLLIAVSQSGESYEAIRICLKSSAYIADNGDRNHERFRKFFSCP